VHRIVGGVDSLSGGQPGFLEMTFQAPPAALHHLLFAERGQEAGGGPAFLVGSLRQGGPDEFDPRQTQFAEQQVDAGGVDLVGHAAAPAVAAMSL
jgi:hypothetical protein